VIAENVTGSVNQELLLQNEYLTAENRILKARLQPGRRLSMASGPPWAETGKRLKRQGRQSRASPNPIPFLPGIAHWWLTNSTAPTAPLAEARTQAELG
jgi:hypothetical protein